MKKLIWLITIMVLATSTLAVDYNITTCQNLSDIRNDLNGDYTLISDVDCSAFGEFTPIGATFTGTLNGAGYTISNIQIGNSSANNVGLFQAVDLTGYNEIYNFTVDNATVSCATYGAVIAAGSAAAGSNEAYFNDINVTNSYVECVTDDAAGFMAAGGGSFQDIFMDNVTANSSSTATPEAGGFTSLYGQDPITMENVHLTNMRVHADGAVGGFFGDKSGTKKITINNFTFQGTISKGSSSSPYWGGILALDDTAAPVNITKGIVNVSFTTTDATPNTDCGGLIGSGRAEPYLINEVRVIMRMDNSPRWCGGLFGIVETANGNLVINNTYTSGNINTSGTGQEVGGFIGIFDSPRQNLTIINSYSDMVINSSEAYAGGLVGYDESQNAGLYENLFTINGIVGYSGALNGIGSVIGWNATVGSITLTNVWWDTSNTVADRCVGGLVASSADGNFTCNSTSTTSDFYDNANEPLASWDFTNIWGFPSGTTGVTTPCLLWEDGCLVPSTPPVQPTLVNHPSSVVVETGTLNSGDVHSMNATDGSYYNVSEVVGVPGVVIRMNITNFTSFNRINFTGNYEGNPAHNVDFNVWNGSTWETLFNLESNSSQSTYTGTLNSTHNVSGTIQIEINHTSSGNVNHLYHIDEVEVYEVVAPVTPIFNKTITFDCETTWCKINGTE